MTHVTHYSISSVTRVTPIIDTSVTSVTDAAPSIATGRAVMTKRRDETAALRQRKFRERKRVGKRVLAIEVENEFVDRLVNWGWITRQCPEPRPREWPSL